MAYLEMRSISKTYPSGVVASAGVNLSLEYGEIHALVGENGAGKSTLMKILYGIEQPDAGEIYLNSRIIRVPNPQAAIRMGIGMVHQHFQLIPSLTVAENVALGFEPRRGLFIDEKRMIDRVAQLSNIFGLAVDPKERVSNLSVGVQQRVEILKLLYRDAKLLILDEPSAVLTPQEVTDLFAILQRLVQDGRTAIFITHKLYEIMSICRRATVLRRGKVVGCVEVAASSPSEIAHLMVGHEVESVKRHAPPLERSESKLSVRSVDAKDDHNLLALQSVSFDVHAGEIFGIAGVEGNGQRELLEILIGKRSVNRGDILINKQHIVGMKPRKRRELGLALIPEDRNREGLSTQLSLWENMVANSYYRYPASRWGILMMNAIRKSARAAISEFDIRTPNETLKVGTLSGGNAQKIVIARELERKPVVLIAAQPTRGLDVGATGFVHEQLLKLRDAGVAVLLISADLDELLALSDRIAVLFGGRILNTLGFEQFTREKLGMYMAGKSDTCES
ncbi:MAG: ABC transporter ATP-binding protein [Anaerolineae bacterium]